MCGAVIGLWSTEYLDLEDFPEHIKCLVQKEKESEEHEKRQREIERNTCKVAMLKFSYVSFSFLFFFFIDKRCLFIFCVHMPSRLNCSACILGR